MRPTKQLHGKLYKIRSLPETSLEPASMCLPKRARGHMVVALGWASDRDVVKVATVGIFALEVPAHTKLTSGQITSSAESTLPYIDYLPIYPSKKNHHNGIQLKLCSDWEHEVILEKNSYVRSDAVYEILIGNLIPVGENGRQYELQSSSWTKMNKFIQDRDWQQAQVTSAPVDADVISSPVL